ncbi:MAG: hypothetical protein IJJ33_17715 [Victivallales bacterium]|nr:hypothetical protein [Victivallales bacterium]
MNENKGINPATQAGAASQGKGGKSPAQIALAVIVALVIFFLTRQNHSPHAPVAEPPQASPATVETLPAPPPATPHDHPPKAITPTAKPAQPPAPITAKPAPDSKPIAPPAPVTAKSAQPPAPVTAKTAQPPAPITAKPAPSSKPTAQPAAKPIPPATSVQAAVSTASAVMAQTKPAQPPAQNIQQARVFKARWHKSNLERHWEKHHAEFPEYHSAKEYGDAALELFEYPPPGTLRKQKENGDRLYYHPPTNRFGVTAADGTPKTMFKPDRGIQYWNRQ